MRHGEIYGIAGRLVEVVKDGEELYLVALDGDGRPHLPPIAFDVTRGDAAIVMTWHNGGTMTAVGVLTLPIDRLELVADNHRTLFAPLPKAMAAIWG